METDRTTPGGATMRRPTPEIPMKALWFGMLGGIIAWAVGFVASYPLAAACWSGAEIAALLVTLATLATAGAAAVVAWRNWQRVRDTSETGSGGWPGRAAFMSLAGILLSLAAVVLTVAHAIPIFVIPPCVSL